MESTVAQKLDALNKLQKIDSNLDEIKKIRGVLPEEVRDLEDEIAGYNTRLEKHQNEINELHEVISSNKNAISDSEKLILKYQDQQMNVRNNREYDALTKEMELQSLEIQICEKRINETQTNIESKNEETAGTQKILEERLKDLEEKKNELDDLIAESEEEEQKLLTQRDKAGSSVEERLFKSYNKIRNNARNGLAVVSVMRNACGGCFNVVPPQRQAEVRERKKIIVCEHCGRILYDVIDEPEKKVKKTKRTRTKK